MSTIKANAYLDASGGNTATINGITPIAQGMTLLGTLTTTSGSTQTLSSLVLTGYKQLVFEWSGTSHNSGSNQTYSIGAGVVITGMTAADFAYGMATVSLVNGLASPILARNNGLPASLGTAQQVAQTGYSTATTSVSVSVSGGAFDAGSITIYGVK